MYQTGALGQQSGPEASLPSNFPPFNHFNEYRSLPAPGAGSAGGGIFVAFCRSRDNKKEAAASLVTECGYFLFTI